MKINENGLRKIVRNILMEMYDPYTDGEGLPMTDYEDGNEDSFDMSGSDWQSGELTDEEQERLDDIVGRIWMQGEENHVPEWKIRQAANKAARKYLTSIGFDPDDFLGNA